MDGDSIGRLVYLGRAWRGLLCCGLSLRTANR